MCWRHCPWLAMQSCTLKWRPWELVVVEEAVAWVELVKSLGHRQRQGRAEHYGKPKVVGGFTASSICLRVPAVATAPQMENPLAQHDLCRMHRE